VAIAPAHQAPVISVRPVTVHRPSAHPHAAPPDNRDAERAGAKQALAQARALLESGRFAEAQATFQRVEESGFFRGPAVTGQAQVAFQQGNYAEAVRVGRRAVEAGGGVPAQMVLGNSYFKLKKFDDAIGEYREVLRVDQGQAEAKYNLAAAEQKKGQ
jgi:tetratricopeptide (TPR) repeat protein